MCLDGIAFLYQVCNLIKSRKADLAIVAIVGRSTPRTPHASNTLRSKRLDPSLACLRAYLVEWNWHLVWAVAVATWRSAYSVVASHVCNANVIGIMRV